MMLSCPHWGLEGCGGSSPAVNPRDKGVGEQRMYSKGVDGNTEDSIPMGRSKPKSKTASFRVLLLL